MLLTAKYVVPVTSSHIEDGAVLVRGEDIADIGPAEELLERYPYEEVKDLGLAVLMPGFVDAHTHLEYAAMRGLIEDQPYANWKMAVNEKSKLFTANDWNDSAALGALEAVASGITTIADITATGVESFIAQE